MKNLKSRAKYISIFCMLLFASSVTLHAQDKAAAKEKERIEKLKSDLGINDDLAQKVLAIEKDSRQKMMEVRKNGNGDKEAMRPQMQAIRKDRDDKLAGILNKEQMSKYTDLEAKKMQGRQGNPGGGRPNE